MNRNRNLQLFAAETNTTVAADLEPAISIDFVTRLVEGIKKLREVLGVTDMIPMPEGTQIKIYEVKKKNTAEQVGEGEKINLTEIERKLKDTKSLTLKKYRKSTTAEAIQKAGYDKAVNMTDEKLMLEAQKEIKTDFFTTLKTGTGTVSATTTNLQMACANLWAKLQTYYEDYDFSPIFFINPQDAADYLGAAQITTQSAFGMSYIENFLGMGTAIINSAITAKDVWATAKENLNGAYIPGGGDLANTFNLTMDETGMVGMKHFTDDTTATFQTLLMSGAMFFPEYADGVFKATIAPGE